MGEPAQLPWNHADPERPSVWVPGFGPCICEWCQAKRDGAPTPVPTSDARAVIRAYLAARDALDHAQTPSDYEAAEVTLRASLAALRQAVAA